MAKEKITQKEKKTRDIRIKHLRPTTRFNDHKRKTASIVIITHEANEKNSKICFKSINRNKNILKAPVLIRLF